MSRAGFVSLHLKGCFLLFFLTTRLCLTLPLIVSIITVEVLGMDTILNASSLTYIIRTTIYKFL